MPKTIRIDGYDLERDFGLFMTSQDVGTPAAKRYTIDVPGGDSIIDLSEAQGHAVFENRVMTFTFIIFNRECRWPELRTTLARLFHGKTVNVVCSWDPSYTYTGFAELEFSTENHVVHNITIKVDAKPYKSGGLVSYRVNPLGGETLTVDCGRMCVCPTIEVSRDTVVTFDGMTWVLTPGAYKLTDLWLTPGGNDIWFYAAPEGEGDLTLGSIGSSTLGDLALTHLCELFWSTTPKVYQTLGEVGPCTLGSIAGKRLGDFREALALDEDDYKAYLQFERGEI